MQAEYPPEIIDEICKDIDVIAGKENLEIGLEQAEKRVEDGDDDKQTYQAVEESGDQIGHVDEKIGSSDQAHDFDFLAMGINSDADGIINHQHARQDEDSDDKQADLVDALGDVVDLL